MSGSDHRRALPHALLTLTMAVLMLSVWQQGHAQTAKPVSKAQVEGRLVLVERLTERSSAALRVKDSTNKEAQEHYAEALALRKEAVAAYETGNYTAANELLSRATREMFEAARKANPEDVLAKKRERDYQDRLASVNALLTAHERVSSEKGATKAHEELQRIVDRQVGDAATLHDKGDPVAGRKTLDEAYVAIKVSIESLRGGDTLVRTLSFATKEEEYHYELDRNDAHRMLVTVLAKEKLASNKAMKKLVQKYLDKAAELRKEAGKLAAAGDYQAAVARLEDSTLQIMRGIRSVGIYIPGG